MEGVLNLIAGLRYQCACNTDSLTYEQDDQQENDQQDGCNDGHHKPSGWHLKIDAEHRAEGIVIDRSGSHEPVPFPPTVTTT